MLDYRLVEALDAVLDAGSFSAAASRLHLTQSAVSQRIKQLEDMLGSPLVVRSTPLQATAAAVRLCAHLRHVRALEAELELLSEPQEPRPFFTVRIGSNADSLATWLLDALRPIMFADHLLFDIISENEDLSYQLLEGGEVLGCLSARRESVSGGQCEYLGKMPYVLVSTKRFAKQYLQPALTRDVIGRAPAVLFDRNDRMHQRFLERELGIKSPEFPHHFVPTSHGFLAVIEKGMAYGVVPLLQAAPLLATNKLVDLAPSHQITVPLYWHYPRREGSLQTKLRKTLTTAARAQLSTP